MTQQVIPFTNQQGSGREALAGGGVVSMNVVSDELGAVRRRPCIAAYTEAPSSVIDANGIEGMYSTADGRVWAIGATGPERAIYKVDGGSAMALGGGAPPNGLRGTGRPVFAETTMLLVLAGGDVMQKVELQSELSSRLGGTPPEASHVCAHALRLVANEPIDTAVVRFSGIASGTLVFGGHEQWNLGVGTAGNVTAEGRPDPVVAVAENTGEVFAFGSQTLQVYSSDPTFVLSPVNTEEVGCAAPYAIVKTDQQFAWLDNYRRFVMSAGRGVSVLSGPIQATLNAMEDVSDCFGFRFVEGPVDTLVWVFPSEGRTFAFQKGGGWSQWSSWSDSTNNWAPFIGMSHCLKTDTNEHLVGTTTGRIGALELATHTDLGTRVPAYVETGYLDNSTDRLKHCTSVRLTLRRGRGSWPDAPQGTLKWRDRPGPWEGEVPVDLGAAGDTEPVLTFYSLGVYRRRQWAFEFSGTEELTLVSAIEDYEVLDS